MSICKNCGLWVHEFNLFEHKITCKSLNSENPTDVSASTPQEPDVYTMLGNGTQSGLSDNDRQEAVKLPLGKRTDDGNICPHCNGTGEYFGGHYGMKLMKCRNCHGKGHL